MDGGEKMKGKTGEKMEERIKIEKTGDRMKEEERNQTNTSIEHFVWGYEKYIYYKTY